MINTDGNQTVANAPEKRERPIAALPANLSELPAEQVHRFFAGLNRKAA